MDPAATLATLGADLAARYQLTDECLTLAGRPLRLRRVSDPDLLLDELCARDPHDTDVEDLRLPYWALVWPAGRALAERVLTGPDLGPDTPTLELGCGLGLVTVAAVLRGAPVLATDYQPEALRFTRLNCLLNAGVEPETGVLDWRAPAATRRYACLLGADLAYETRFFQPLLDCFARLLEPDGVILFGEPNRAVARSFFAALPAAGWAHEVLTATPDVTTYRLWRRQVTAACRQPAAAL